MKTLRPLLLVTCALFFSASARATTVIPPSFDELVAQAELIFQGTVTDVKSEWVGEGGQRHIVSYVTLKVDDSIKGTPGESYTVRMLGGTVGDESMKVSDSPEFKVGDRDILFVENNGKQFIPLVGIMHGRFRVERDSVTSIEVVKSNKGVPIIDLKELGKDDDHAPTLDRRQATPNSTNSGKPLDTDSFKSAIRAKLGDVS